MRTLLIVEDNADICKQLKWGLSNDYHLLFAKNVQEAIKHVTKHQPPVVTLDLGLENITDEDYRVHGSGSNRPGRSLVVGLRYRL